MKYFIFTNIMNIFIRGSNTRSRLLVFYFFLSLRSPTFVVYHRVVLDVTIWNRRIGDCLVGRAVKIQRLKYALCCWLMVDQDAGRMPVVWLTPRHSFFLSLSLSPALLLPHTDAYIYIYTNIIPSNIAIYSFFHHKKHSLIVPSKYSLRNLSSTQVYSVYRIFSIITSFAYPRIIHTHVFLRIIAIVMGDE